MASKASKRELREPSRIDTPVSTHGLAQEKIVGLNIPTGVRRAGVLALTLIYWFSWVKRHRGTAGVQTQPSAEAGRGLNVTPRFH